jgi:DNA polymerase III alpha subunit (gram-positive type)
MKSLFLISVFVLGLSFTSPAQPNPQQAPEKWLLAFLDVETTGLNAGYHEMVDFGVVIADLEGNEIDRFLIRIMPDHPERAHPIANEITGFTVELWEELGAVSKAAAVDSIVAFYKRTAGDKYVLQVAYNTAFDFAFVDHLFRDVGRSFDEIMYYYKLDLPSMAWMLGLRHLHGGELADYFGIFGTSPIPIEHTGLGCADFGIRLYRELLKMANQKSTN